MSKQHIKKENPVVRVSKIDCYGLRFATENDEFVKNRFQSDQELIEGYEQCRKLNPDHFCGVPMHPVLRAHYLKKSKAEIQEDKKRLAAIKRKAKADFQAYLDLPKRARPYKKAENSKKRD